MIGVFDSGIGGLTVVRKMHGEEIVYFADTAHLPYGEKSKEDIIGYAREIINFLISKGAESIVIACNTATAACLKEMKSEFDIPITGVIEAGAKGAVATTKNKKVGVIATAGTIKSGAYTDEIKNMDSDICVFGQACPDFVTMAEAGIWSGPELEKKAREYLKPLTEAGVDTIVLGCTHFPLLRETLEKLTDAEFVDPADYIILPDSNARKNTEDGPNSVDSMNVNVTAGTGNKKSTNEFFASALNDGDIKPYYEALLKVLSSEEASGWTVHEYS